MQQLSCCPTHAVDNGIQQVCHTLLGRAAEQQQVLVQQRVTAKLTFTLCFHYLVNNTEAISQATQPKQSPCAEQGHCMLQKEKGKKRAQE